MANVFNQASKILKAKKSHKRWISIVLCLAIIVGFGTVAALKKPGEAMTYKDKVLDCPYEGADYPVAHTHDENCYDAEGNLVCPLPELEEHTHDDSCYTEETVLVCGLEEAEGHTHTDACYSLVRGDLICTNEDEDHEHTDECYAWNEELTCGLEETEGHTHTDACYETVSTLTCGKTETVEAHVHGANCFVEPIADVTVPDDEVVTRDAAGVDDAEAEPAAETEPVGEPDAEITDPVVETGTEASVPAAETDAETAEETETGTEPASEPETADDEAADPEAEPADAEAETDAETEPEEITYPAQSFEAEVDGIAVSVSAPEGAFPKGTTMTVTPVYDDVLFQTVNEAVDGEIKTFQAVDITFKNADGEEIEPALPITVTMTGDVISGAKEPIVVHIDNDGDASFVEQAENSDASKVVFDSDSFSVYAVVETIVKQVVTADGDTVKVTVTATDKADVAMLDDLRVEELDPHDNEYWDAYDAVVEAKMKEDPDFDESTFGFLPLDIALLDEDGEEFEPAGSIDVKIEFTEFPDDTDADILTSTMEVQHLAEKNGEIEVETVATSDDVTEKNEVVTAEFTVDSFSTFTLTWTGEGETVVIGDDEASGDLNIQVGGETYAGITVHYVDEYGHNIESPLTEAVSGESPVTLQDLLALEIEGYEFVEGGVYLNSYTSETEHGQQVTTAAVERTTTTSTETTYTYIGNTGNGGRINGSQTRPAGYTEFYGDENGNTQIYWITGISGNQNNRFHTRQNNLGNGTRYNNGAVYGKSTGLVTKNAYTLTLSDGETNVILEETTSGTWTDAADIYVVYRSTNTDLKHATVHFGSLNADGSFTELEESTSIDTNGGSINLNTTILPNYEYVGAYYCASETEAPADDGTAILSVLRSVEDQWQYTESNPGEDGTSATGFVADGAHIYVSYMPKTTPSTSTPDDEEIPAPETVKNVTDNGDGTYNIQLDIIGQEIVNTERKGANVLLIFDRTSSMSNDITGADNRFEAAKSAVRTLVTALDPATNPVELAVFSFDRNANTPYSANGSYWTTSGSAITDFTDDLTMAPSGATQGYGGTNWEAAFTQAATVLATADSDPTYVIFLTDGNPTIYVGSTTIRNATETSNEYTRARTAANNLDTKYKIYGILCANQSDGPLLQTLITYLSNQGHDATHILANNATTLTNTFKDIADYVVSQLGASDVSTNDGVTSLSDVSATVNGAAGAFEYYKAYLVTLKDDGKYYYSDEEGKEHEVAAADVKTYEYLDAEGNEESYLYYNRQVWEDYAAASYNKATGVTWNLSSEGTLSAGSIYSVSFTVWPSQAAYDLLADLNNGLKKYEAGYDNSITAEERAQVYESGGVYYMKTNTNLDTTYTFGNTTYTDGVEFHQGAMDLDTETIALRKLWPENMLDEYGEGWSQGGTQNSITLTITRDGDDYMDVTVTKDDDWFKDNIYISCGVMTVHNGVVDLKTTGHDYTVVEPSSFSYYWDLVADVYHPMVINGTTTMLILDKTLKDADVDNSTVYKLDGKYYRVQTAAANTLEASNYRRSNLNLTKTVTGDNAPANATFTYTATITDIAGEDIWFSAQTVDDAANKREIYQKLEVSDNVKPEYRTVAGATYNAVDDTYTYEYGGKTYTLPAADGGAGGYMYTGYYSVKSGQEFTFTMKADWNVRFINLLHGSTYEIDETGMVDGFFFDSIAPTTLYALETDAEWYDITGSSVEGEITEPNNSYKLTYTNKWTTVPFELKKVDENDAVLSGAVFDLETLLDGTWTKTRTGIQPDDDNNPIEIGGLGIGKYRLVEMSAPDGYVILTKNVYFEVYKDAGVLQARFNDENGNVIASMNEAEITSSTEGDVTTWLVTVSNTPGTALPMTGGQGTAGIITFGLALMAASLILLSGRVMYLRKRRTRESEGR